MWILINEIIIFGIMLALIVGHFGGVGLGINKEVAFKSIAQEKIKMIKGKIDEQNKDHIVLSGDIDYKIKRVVAFNHDTSYVAYKLIITNKRGKKIEGEDFKKITSYIFSGNVYQKNNTYKNNSIVYNGLPAYINHSFGNINTAKNHFSKYKIAILGKDVDYILNHNYLKTKEIVKGLKGTTKFYGKISLIKNGTNTYEQIIDEINKWRNVGVDGIYITDAGYERWKNFVSDSIIDYREYFRKIYIYTKLLGMNVTIDVGNPNNILGKIKLSPSDIIMIKNYYYKNGIKTSGNINNVQSYKNKLQSLNSKSGIMCIATSTNNNQNKVNDIKSDIGDDMTNTCHYTSIQDDYGQDGSHTIINPTN